MAENDGGYLIGEPVTVFELVVRPGEEQHDSASEERLLRVAIAELCD